MEFGEYLCEEILKAVPHRHFTFSIPKILRRYFLYDRSLLSDLSRCGWESLKVFFQEAVPVGDPVLGGEKGATPGAVVAIHSFGDFLQFHPHLHMLCLGNFHLIRWWKNDTCIKVASHIGQRYARLPTQLWSMSSTNCESAESILLQAWVSPVSDRYA